MPQKYDLLVRLYDLNERYHDQKDTRAWIATTLYLTYAGALLSWLIKPTVNIDNLIGIISLIVHCFVSIAAVLYVMFQFQLKSMSLESESALQKELRKLTKADLASLKNPTDRKPLPFDRLPVYSIILMFFTIDTMIIIRSLSNEPTIDMSRLDVCLLIILIVAILLLAMLSSALIAIYCGKSKKRSGR
jgi:flagellar basal body-associated protein FliL